MKATITHADLHEGLTHASRGAANRPMLAVLSNVRLTARPGELVLAATDLETGLLISLPADVTEPGETTVPAKLFADLVSRSPDQRVQLHVNGKELLDYRCDRVRATLNTIGADEFPLVPEALPEHVLTVEAGPLADAIRKGTISTTPPKERGARPVLDGVHWQTTKKGLVIESADGYTLSSVLMPGVGDDGAALDAIVPANSVKTLHTLLAKLPATEPVFLGVGLGTDGNASRIMWKFANVLLTSTLIEGKYPDLKRLTPAESDTTFTADRSDLYDAVRRARLIVKEAAQMLHVEFRPNELVLSGDATGVGRHEESIPGALEGEPLALYLNAQYAEESFAVLPDGPVTIGANDAAKPILVRSPQDERTTHVIMPMSKGKEK